MTAKKTDKPWTKKDEDFIRQHATSMITPDIASALGRTENCVNIKMHRLRIDRQRGGLNKEMVKRNMVQEMLTQRIGDPESFRYTPKFRANTGIGQKRFWQLYRGEKNLQLEEYISLTREWNITLEDAFDMQQLKMDLFE